MGLLNKDIKDVGIKRFRDLFKYVIDGDQPDYQGNNPGAELLIYNMLRSSNLRYKILDLSTTDTQLAFEKMIINHIQSTLDDSIKQMNYCGVVDPSTIVNKDELNRQITDAVMAISISVDIQKENNEVVGFCTILIDGQPFKRFYFTQQ